LALPNGKMPPVLVLEDANMLDPGLLESIATNPEIKRIYYTVCPVGPSAGWFQGRFDMAEAQLIAMRTGHSGVERDVPGVGIVRTVFAIFGPRPLGLNLAG